MLLLIVREILILCISVPDSLDGEFRVTNLEWEPDLANKSSQTYQELSKKLEMELSQLYNDSKIEITDLSEGSVIVKFRLISRDGRKINREDILKKLLERNDGTNALQELEIDNDSINVDCKYHFNLKTYGVRPSVRHKKHATTLHEAWWVTLKSPDLFHF